MLAISSKMKQTEKISLKILHEKMQRKNWVKKQTLKITICAHDIMRLLPSHHSVAFCMTPPSNLVLHYSYAIQINFYQVD